MKSLHLIAAKKDNPRKGISYIQIREGRANATNGFALITVPVHLVLTDAVNADEELYFNANEWKASKMFKAVFVSREGLYFNALDKRGAVIGRLKALTKEEFTEQFGLYPDYQRVLPDITNAKELKSVAFNPSLLKDIYEAFGEHPSDLKLTFFGPDKMILISSCGTESIAVLMTLRLLEREAVEEETISDNDYSDLL